MGERDREAARVKLLVIDDEEEVREMLSFALPQSGYVVATARGGAEGVERVRQEPFDLAITDLKMPGMDGVATTLALRAVRPELHVVIMSGFVPADGVAACLACGAAAFLRKPFSLKELEALLRRTLGRDHVEAG
jgi:CheY-like chemotaxis protein